MKKKANKEKTKNKLTVVEKQTNIIICLLDSFVSHKFGSESSYLSRLLRLC